jgi:hypothetical protein
MFAEGILESHLDLSSTVCLYPNFPFPTPKLANQYSLINPSFVATSGVNRIVKSPFHRLDREMGSFGDKQ